MITTQPVSASGKEGVPFLARDKSRPSTSKGASVKEFPPPRPLVPRDEMTEIIGKRRFSCRSAIGIAYNPEGCLFVHDHIHPEYYHRMERQRCKDSSAWDEPTMLKQARRELATLRVICHEG